jgi:hypothetical protein
MGFAPRVLEQGGPGPRRVAGSLATVAAAAMVTVGTGGLPAQAGSTIPAIPKTNPVNWTPRVVDDGVVREAGVRELRRVGRNMYAGGHLNKVLNAAGTRAFTRRNLFSFNARTGVVTRWAPRVSGAVYALEASRDGRYLYVGGKFGSFDGRSVNGLVKYDLVNRRVDRRFRFPVAVSNVTDLQLVRGRLFVAGTFRGGIVAVNPRTGARTAYLNRTRAAGTERGWSTRIYRFAVSPDATRMVVIGSFTSIGGKARQQAAMINLGRTATVAGWYSPRWNLDCAAAYRWYTRDVDWSPDGRRFAIVTSGSSFPRTRKLCTTATWWKPAGRGSQQPLWVNHTGGDTIHSVAATSRAVFVSGHIRWLNNPLGVNSRGPGAVQRRGLAAINKRTGKATRWNPTKSLEGGLGGFDLDFTSQGLWVAHFEQYLGRDAGGPERHEGVGLFPY